jgi:hypothetical protein
MMHVPTFISTSHTRPGRIQRLPAIISTYKEDMGIWLNMSSTLPYFPFDMVNLMLCTRPARVQKLPTIMHTSIRPGNEAKYVLHPTLQVHSIIHATLVPLMSMVELVFGKQE